MFYVEIINAWGDGLGKDDYPTLDQAREQASDLCGSLDPGESVRITSDEEES